MRPRNGRLYLSIARSRNAPAQGDAEMVELLAIGADRWRQRSKLPEYSRARREIAAAILQPWRRTDEKTERHRGGSKDPWL
jgi:hypothetical protein